MTDDDEGQEIEPIPIHELAADFTAALLSAGVDAGAAPGIAWKVAVPAFMRAAAEFEQDQEMYLAAGGFKVEGGE